MKNNWLKNPFSQETKELFADNYSCWECGRSDRGLEAHHILKRVSANVFNLAPLYPAPPGIKRVFVLDEDESWGDQLIYKEN